LSWDRLLSVDAGLKLLPTFGTAAMLMYTLERFSHPLALPAVLLAIPLLFHAVSRAMVYLLDSAVCLLSQCMRGLRSVLGEY
jgi:SulP family sulfate permease